MADSAPVMLWGTLAEPGTDRLSRWFNQAWQVFAGGSALDAYNEHQWLQAVHPDDVGNYQTQFAAAYHAQQAYSLDYRLQHAGDP